MLRVKGNQKGRIMPIGQARQYNIGNFLLMDAILFKASKRNVGDMVFLMTSTAESKQSFE